MPAKTSHVMLLPIKSVINIASLNTERWGAGDRRKDDRAKRKSCLSIQFICNPVFIFVVEVMVLELGIGRYTNENTRTPKKMVSVQPYSAMLKKGMLKSIFQNFCFSLTTFLSTTALNLCPQKNKFEHHWIKTGEKLNMRHRWFDLKA